MQASNNSPLPKGDLNNQELKTKGTIWKPLIAVSLLSIFSFTVGQYLPYVIAAVSGSGAIAAVPLAIFAVSAVVALISTIYLIRLTVSRADNKKEAGPDGKESGYTPSKEPQKFVCKNCTNLENKSNVPTPQSPLVTFGTQPNPSANMLQPPPPLLSSCAPPPSPPMLTPEQLSQASGAVPPPPPPPLPPGGLKNWNPAKNNTTGEKSPVGTTQNNTSYPKKPTPQEDGKQVSVNLDDILQGKRNLRKPGAKGGQKPDGGDSNSMDIARILARRPAMELSDDEDEHESGVDDDEWNDDEEGTKTPDSDNVSDNEDLNAGQNVQDPQSFHRERSGSLDSGHGSGDDVHSKLTSPLPPEPKAEKPPKPLKPANLQMRPQPSPETKVNNVDPVNSEMQEPSTLSFKDRCGIFGGVTNEYEKPSMVSVY